ncbi:MAG: hypothetical protein ACE5K2_01110 [Candidatus Zixiibacteriota bacterium]
MTSLCWISDVVTKVVSLLLGAIIVADRFANNAPKPFASCVGG